ncbi:MAG TPA: TonB-dependent receptor, partial [Terriglobia bacterium]|nr:TonB-dependent receptor [Terriglobia bacterium]
MPLKHFVLGRMVSALWFVSCLAFATNGWAQLSTSATINGTVTDASGAVIPQASVVVINEATGVRTTTQTNNDGSFVLPGLVVGTYTVTVSKQGFQTHTEKGVVLHPTAVTTVNAALNVGAVVSEVTVAASAAQIQTATHELSSEVAEEQVATLPLNGRNYQSLSALMPGVTNMNPGVAQNQGGFLTSNVMSINGMGQSGTLYTLDGIWNMNTGNMTQTTITPNPDTVQEVRVLQNNYSVQYSLMGANVVLLETKSGTEKFHGTGFEYFRNDALDARNFFSPTVPGLKQNIFGYTLSGPVFIPNHYNTNRQKTFFFWSQQWVRQHIASTVLGATPTADMRNGVFSHPITDPVTGQPFPTDGAGHWVIPQDRLSSDALALLNAHAQLPNNPAGGFNNFINLTPQINTQRDDEIRVDHNFTDKVRLLAEYLDERQLNKNPNDTFLGSPFTTSSDPITTRNQLAQLQLTATISPAMVNTISVAMNNYVVDLAIAGITKRSQVPGFREVLPFEGGFGSDRLPQVNFTGGWSPIGVAYTLPLNHASDLEDTLTDDWSWLRGNHYIQAGINIVFGTKRQTDFAASNGQWFFNGQFTGDPIADYLLGLPNQFQQASTETRPYVHYKIVSPYAQDRWKINRKLTVTAGIRLEYLPAPHPQRGYETIFDPARYNPANAPIVNNDGTITPTATYDPLNGLIFNGVNGVPLNFADTYKYMWAPSVGFAYDVFGDGKTALRGGYGITYNRVPTGTDCSYFCGNNPPRVQSLTLINPPFPNPAGGVVAPAGTPTMVSEDLNLHPAGMIQTYSLSLEHQFAGNWFTSIAGAGNIGHHVGTYWDRNQALPDPPYDFNPLINSGTVFAYKFAPYLGYGQINTNVSYANLYWNALEINVRHPIGHNLFLTVAYTWQHGLSDTRGQVFFENSNTTQDTYHPRSGYGTSNLNAPQILAISHIWSLPWYQQAKGLTGAALGGWKYAGITTIQSGFALDPGLSVAFQGLATRPDRISGSLTGPKTVQQWFNTAAFAQPPAGYFGNAGTGIIQGPGVI